MEFTNEHLDELGRAVFDGYYEDYRGLVMPWDKGI